MMGVLQEVASLVGGRLHGEDRAYGSVSTDTRTLQPGALFFALQGPRFDGAQFVAAAAAGGAAGAVVPQRVATSLPQIEVGDTLVALQVLGTHWRRRFAGPLVAVAGSNGKTTVKEMTATILACAGPTLATLGNLNNHIGVPLTLLRLDATVRAAVVELGANRIGDVAQLMAFAQPTASVITNAGAEHLEGFGDLDGVARGEGEAIGSLAADGIAIINADDSYAGYWQQVAGERRTLRFGVRAPADFSASGVRHGIEDGEFLTRFTLGTPAGTAAIALHAGGAHNVLNALAAAAAASAAGATLDDIVTGLGRFRPVGGRLQLKPGLRGGWIIDDSYNANPSSVHAGLEVLRTLPRPTWVVLGEMAELGAASVDAHRAAGTQARDCGVARLLCVGPTTPHAVAAFGDGAEWFADVEALISRLRSELPAAVTLLVKGSRVNRLERVVAAVARAAAATAAGVH
jgi:UDP-N-acetylmuramoyl-tripeptide--D-alanyl-D-alanine ligase